MIVAALRHLHAVPRSTYGSEEQKRKLRCPAAIRGEILLGIGMTEPGTGSDLAERADARASATATTTS